jgi:hypothetical protein
MPQERWPAVIHSWIPAGRRKMGQPRCSWQDGITEEMEERGMVAEDAQRWILWRRKLGRRWTAVCVCVYWPHLFVFLKNSPPSSSRFILF